MLILASMLSFHAAFLGAKRFHPAGWLVLGYLGALWMLRRQTTPRRAFWCGTVVGLGIFVPQTAFLGTIFSVSIAGFQIPVMAAVLWLLVALWHGVFLLLVRSAELRVGTAWAWVTAPVFWMGTEYFRSEIWWLRFSWLAVGSAFEGPAGWWRAFGVYGIGGFVWVLLAGAALVQRREPRWRVVGWTAFFAAAAAVLVAGIPRPSGSTPPAAIEVAGVQLEFPGGPEVLPALNRLVAKYPTAELIVLSEYTFDGPPPAPVREWCRARRKWLVAGGRETVDADADAGSVARDLSPATGGTPAFRNTAFVVGPTGEIEFTQAKMQPIQFFSDGLPARSQKLWQSPWGLLGIAICYDASYRTVLDELIRQGARGLLLPTMDLLEWGRHEHDLNAGQARLRAREYGVPVLRLASSGPSMLFDATGRAIASAPLAAAGEDSMLGGVMSLSPSVSRAPLDAWVAPLCSMVTVGWAFWGMAESVVVWVKVRQRPHRRDAPAKISGICG